jgi:hypothetical protein
MSCIVASRRQTSVGRRILELYRRFVLVLALVLMVEMALLLL